MIGQPDQPFKWFGVRQTAKRFDRVAFQLGLARQSVTPDAVHDLRVSIRRMLTALSCFSRLFKKKDLREFSARVEGVLINAGAVRDYDIALKLAAEAEIDSSSSLVKALAGKRKLRARELARELRRGAIRKFSLRWRERLGLL